MDAKRLTPEREQEIREALEIHRCLIESNVIPLLEEIDALRAELQTSLTMTEANIRIAKEAEKERDQLKAENEKLGEALAACPACGTEWDLKQVTQCRMDIVKENQKLRERVTNLRGVIEWASVCGEAWIDKSLHPTYEAIGKAMLKAMTEDDERAKQI